MFLVILVFSVIVIWYPIFMSLDQIRVLLDTGNVSILNPGGDSFVSSIL